MTYYLYNAIIQRMLQQAQKDLEQISNENSKMEQEFEQQIKNRNKQNKEYGLFVRAINNVYNKCITQLKKKGKS